MNLLSLLRDRFRPALADYPGDVDEWLALIRPAQNPQFGDYQANMAMALSKQVEGNARDVAADIVAKLDIEEICEPPEVAGPGFINLRLKQDWLVEQLTEAIGDERLTIPVTESPQTVVLDYSSPNVAKPMHVGHIRSTVIGDTLYRVLAFLGHKAISDNHLGDWGTQFGMIIYGFKHFVDREAYDQDPVSELGRLYRLVNQLIEFKPDNEAAAPGLQKLAAEHADIGRAVLAETVKLHEGDEENLALWNEFMPACRSMLQETYDRLDIKFDYELGESHYHNQLESVVQDFQDKGLARESDGAMCVFLEGYKAPMIIRKGDGAFLYATTDMATIKYRMETWNPDYVLYVVDSRQSEHFGKLFAAAKLWGFADVDLRHVSFGTVMDKHGKPFKTRSGDAAGLRSLLDEAVQHAAAIIEQNSPHLNEAERASIADTIGHGAVKYFDLSHNRTSDYKFDPLQMVKNEGNTATYMQYSYARTQGIFTRAEVDVEALRSSFAKIQITDPAERELAVAILQLGDAIDDVVTEFYPHLLTNYLFQLAKKFSVFFEKCHVIRAENEALKQSRLLLCDLVGRTIKLGLDLIGIGVVPRM